jgi:hypothetical protein
MAIDPTGSEPTPPPSQPASTPPPAFGGGGHASLVERARKILLQPAAEWTRIDGEATSIGRLITGYAAILALIAPIAALLSILLTPFGSYLFNAMGFLIKVLLIVYAISLGVVLLLGLAIDLLAPSLGGTRNSVQAMKLAVYAGTAFWVAAVAIILSPWLWIVIGIGYGGYLIWLGLPTLMRVPADKAPTYAAAVIVIWVVLAAILYQVAWRLIFSALTGGLV